MSAHVKRREKRAPTPAAARGGRRESYVDPQKNVRGGIERLPEITDHASKVLILARLAIRQQKVFLSELFAKPIGELRIEIAK